MPSSVVSRPVPVYRPVARFILCLLAFVALVAASGVASAAGHFDIKLKDGTTVTMETHPASGKSLVLWLPSGFGRFAGETQVAERLAVLGVEVWQADLLEARFLPPLESSLDKIPEGDVAELIDAAAKTGKRVYLLTTARGGIVGLRGAQAWQKRNPTSNVLGGALLLHPNLFLGPPEPGEGGRVPSEYGANAVAGVHPPARAIAVALAVGGNTKGTGERRRESVHARAHRRARPVLFPSRRDRASKWMWPTAWPEMLRDSIQTLNDVKLAEVPAARTSKTPGTKAYRVNGTQTTTL